MEDSKCYYWLWMIIVGNGRCVLKNPVPNKATLWSLLQNNKIVNQHLPRYNNQSLSNIVDSQLKLRISGIIAANSLSSYLWIIFSVKSNLALRRAIRILKEFHHCNYIFLNFKYFFSYNLEKFTWLETACVCISQKCTKVVVAIFGANQEYLVNFMEQQ